jgi:hypothetical protein
MRMQARMHAFQEQRAAFAPRVCNPMVHCGRKDRQSHQEKYIYSAAMPFSDNEPCA